MPPKQAPKKTGSLTLSDCKKPPPKRDGTLTLKEAFEKYCPDLKEVPVYRTVSPRPGDEEEYDDLALDEDDDALVMEAVEADEDEPEVQVDKDEIIKAVLSDPRWKRNRRAQTIKQAHILMRAQRDYTYRYGEGNAQTDQEVADDVPPEDLGGRYELVPDPNGSIQPAAMEGYYKDEITGVLMKTISNSNSSGRISVVADQRKTDEEHD